MTNAILMGKPEAGTSHFRVAEGKAALSMPRRGTLLGKRELAVSVAVASVSLLVAAVFHRFLPGFGLAFKPLLWPLAVLPFCVRPRFAVTTAVLVPLLSAAVNGMPSWPVALSLSVLAGAVVSVIALARLAR